MAGARPRPAPTVRTRDEPEGGRVMILILGFTILALLVVTVVTAASAVYIGHKRLLSVADAASFAAADTFTLGAVVDGAGAPVTVLDDTAVRAAALSYLSRTNASDRFDGLAVDARTGTPDTRTAHVVLTAVVRPPIINFLVPSGVPITAVADARSRLSR